MAKISAETRHRYFEKAKEFRQTIELILQHEQTMILAIQQDPENAPLTRVALANEMLNLASHYIILSNISLSMLNIKNELALNDARKVLYKSIIYLEETVSNLLDAPFSDYEDKLTALESIDAAGRYHLIRKLGLSIELLKSAYGDNTKWRWAFVELEGRYAVVAKNILDLKKVVVNTDPRSPYYEPTVYQMRLVKQLLTQAADRYREMYELSTNRIEDFNQGIHFLGALRRIHALIGEQDKAELVKKKMDIWSAKLEADLRKREDSGLKKIQDAKIVS
ncbi:MAG: hypothetical protein LBC60_04020 [Spirochaetaceae bacterium]|jgi:hypothetical protein|nr:hypothetical protein [Spirochaetaceae bacterium]